MENKEYRKKYQRKWARNKREKQKIEKQKIKLANELLFEKAEKEVFKIQALTYKQTNEKAREFVLIWGEVLDKDFQKQLLEILKGE